jgi:two-component system C4-dicarboxylate transport sensor histidine kinase DctB
MDITSNALDACDLKEFSDGEDPEILIRVYRSEDGRWAVIELIDNGVGMTPDVRTNVFTPFFSTKKKTGTGLGLALTSRVIELHNGKIVVESEPQKGSVFRITLPLEGQTGETGGSI